MTLERLRRLLYAALVATVFAYALLIIHNFYTYIDYAIYVATDDSLANISYAWATIGRYGFLTSPHLGLVARTHGQFNYGPWYFGLGAALIWLFGYSLTVLRSIHLWVIVFICGAAMRWFRDGHYSPAWVVAAMGALSWFVTTQWPMVRPDSMVSLFAVLMVIAAGRAVERGSRTMWAAAGVAAACGAFTHLIAWSLVPAVGAAWLGSELLLLKRPIDRPQVRAAALRLASLAVGLAIGALMFYASFGFGFRTQLRFLRLYSDSTRAMLATGGQSLSAWHLFSRHFQAAFGHLSLFQQRTFVAALISGWVLVVWSVRWREDARRIFLAFCLPPLLAWTFYSLSLSTYANFHSGYKVLTQVMALWLVASLVFVGLRALWSTVPVLASVVALAVTMACFYSSAIALRRSIKESDNRLLRTHEWVSISQYIDEMLAPIPDGATAWGTIMYGIENPGRIQLIQFGDAMQLTVALPAAERARLAPQYLVFGSQENAGSMSAVLGGTRNSLQIFNSLFPDARYQLIAMVSAPPYGVTRIYGRLLEPRPDAVPVVSVFDPLTHQWSRRVERIAAALEPSEPVLLNFPWGGRVLHRRTDTTRALSLPAGDYVIRTRLQPGSTSKGGGVIASDHLDLDPEVNDFGVSSDVASYKLGDTEAYLVWRHEGGLLHVGVIDEDRTTAITGIEAYRLDPMRPLDTEPAVFRPIASWNAWDPLTTLGVRAVTSPDGLAVDGNDSRFGYQLMSPEIKMPAGARVRLRVQQQVERGRVCVGVLNKTQQHWLISPDQARPGYELIADDSGAIRVVFANCGPADGPTTASRFVITAADYAVLERHLYADQLMDAYEAATRAQ